MRLNFKGTVLSKCDFHLLTPHYDTVCTEVLGDGNTVFDLLKMSADVTFPKSVAIKT